MIDIDIRSFCTDKHYRVMCKNLEH
jgi:hypothetical protein